MLCKLVTKAARSASFKSLTSFSTPNLLLAKSSTCLLREFVLAPISPLLLDIWTCVDAMLSNCLEGNWSLSYNF